MAYQASSTTPQMAAQFMMSRMEHRKEWWLLGTGLCVLVYEKKYAKYHKTTNIWGGSAILIHVLLRIYVKLNTIGHTVLCSQLFEQWSINVRLNVVNEARRKGWTQLMRFNIHLRVQLERVGSCFWLQRPRKVICILISYWNSVL